MKPRPLCYKWRKSALVCDEFGPESVMHELLGLKDDICY